MPVDGPWVEEQPWLSARWALAWLDRCGAATNSERGDDRRVPEGPSEWERRCREGGCGPCDVGLGGWRGERDRVVRT